MGRFDTIARRTLLATAIGFATAAPVSAQETPLTFSGLVTFVLPEPFFPTMFRVRDLDGDGLVDLALAGRDPENRLFTLKGGPGATFTILQTLETDGFTDWLELADLDGDGVEDLVTAWKGDAPRLVYHRGIGNGQFEPAVVLAGVEMGMGRDPQGVAVGDFDGDGDADVALSLYSGLHVDVFSNNGLVAGKPVFERTGRVRLGTFLGGLSFPRVLFAADVDGDKDLDLVVNELGGGRLAMIRNEGGRFVRAVETRAPRIGDERPGISSLQLVDLDGDGDLDAALPGLLIASAQKVVAFLNDGSGGFAERAVGTGADIGYAFAIACADFDGDGDLDAVTGQALPGGLAVLRRVNSAAFDFEVDLAPQFGSLIRHLEAADVDNDCDLDIIGIDGPGRMVFVRRNTTPQQSGCGGLADAAMRGEDPAVEGPAPTPKGLAREPVAKHDFDQDGVHTASDIAVWLNGLRRAPVSVSGAAPVSSPVSSPVSASARSPVSSAPSRSKEAKP
jgi:hypothetical protein